MNPEVRKGTSYRAASWIPVGQTCGRGKLDVNKQFTLPVTDIPLTPIHPYWQSILNRYLGTLSYISFERLSVDNGAVKAPPAGIRPRTLESGAGRRERESDIAESVAARILFRLETDGSASFLVQLFIVAVLEKRPA